MLNFFALVFGTTRYPGGSINRKSRVDFFCPGIDTATQIINLFEARMLEKQGYALATDAVMTDNYDRLFAI